MRSVLEAVKNIPISFSSSDKSITAAGRIRV